MIATLLLFISVAVVSIVERLVKPWRIRVLLNLAFLGVMSGIVLNIGLSAGESSTRGIIAREVAQAFDEFTNGTETNRTGEANSDIREFQERVLKIVAAEDKK
jgi:hypothetical protein